MRLYVQANRRESAMGVNELREFVAQVIQKIVFINCRRLVELMIDYGVGVSTRETYVLKRADEDYFAEG